jgi:hypothetical protein
MRHLRISGRATVTDGAHLFALFAAGLLVIALVAWVKLGPRPMLQRLRGRRGADTRQTEHASQLLVLAFGLSAIAAVLAVGGWIGL